MIVNQNPVIFATLMMQQINTFYLNHTRIVKHFIIQNENNKHKFKI